MPLKHSPQFKGTSSSFSLRIQKEFSLALIVPCYNEFNRLAAEEFLKAIDKYPKMEMYLVNDGSTDSTLSLLQDLQTRCTCPNRIKIIDLGINQGKAEAVRQGMLHALKVKSYELYGFLDADLSTSFEDFFNLVNYITENFSKKYVWGARIPRRGTNIVRKRYRHLLGRIISFYTRFLLVIPVYDTQCGAKVFCEDWVEQIFSAPFKSRWLFDIEIFLRLQNLFSREELLIYTYEYPLKAWNHVAGSKVMSISSLRVLVDLLCLAYGYKKEHYPGANPTKASPQQLNPFNAFFSL